MRWLDVVPTGLVAVAMYGVAVACIGWLGATFIFAISFGVAYTLVSKCSGIKKEL